MRHAEELGCPMLEIYPEERLIPAKEGYSFQRDEIKLVDDGGKALKALDKKILKTTGKRMDDQKKKLKKLRDSNFTHA